MEEGGGAALTSPAAILHAAAPAALLKGESAQLLGGQVAAHCTLPLTFAAHPHPSLLLAFTAPCRSPSRLLALDFGFQPAGASLAGAAIQTALIGRWAGSTALAAYAAVNAVTRLATLLAFSFFVDAAAARLSRALGRHDAATARSQVGGDHVGRLGARSS